MLIKLLGSVAPELLEKIQHDFALVRFPVIQASQVRLTLVDDLDLSNLVELCYKYGVTVFTAQPTL